MRFISDGRISHVNTGPARNEPLDSCPLATRPQFTFAARVPYGAGNGPFFVAIGDLDRDGNADLAVANWGSDSVSILLNQCPTICEGDANGDGTVDPLDAGFVLARFGCNYPADGENCLAADVNGDGTVNPLDSGFVLARFGDCL